MADASFGFPVALTTEDIERLCDDPDLVTVNEEGVCPVFGGCVGFWVFGEGEVKHA